MYGRAAHRVQNSRPATRARGSLRDKRPRVALRTRTHAHHAHARSSHVRRIAPGGPARVNRSALPAHRRPRARNRTVTRTTAAVLLLSFRPRSSPVVVGQFDATAAARRLHYYNTARVRRPPTTAEFGGST